MPSIVFVSRARATHAHRLHMVFMMRRNVNASSSTTATQQPRKPEPPAQQPPRQKKLSFREPEVVVSSRGSGGVGGGGGKSRTAAASAQVTARVSASALVPDCGRADEFGLDDEQLQVTTASSGGIRRTRVVRIVVFLIRRSSPFGCGPN